jgi:F420-dependent oxidoreductase-like protein
VRFALSTSPQRTTWPWLLEVWQRADRHPVFESAWTFDHLYPLFGDSTDDCLDGWMTLAALLHETRRIRGGVLVSGIVYRHPGVLANMASTLDITSGGRLELGVGAGWNVEECDAFGIELGTMAERFDRFEEALAVLEGLFTQDRTSFHGRYFQLNGAMNHPAPLQAPLPICIGGRGKRRTIPLAARYAHHWNYSGTDTDEFADLRATLHEHCERLGRDPGDITCSVLVRWTGDAGAFGADVDAWAAAGADLSIIAIAKSEDPTVVDDVAGVIAH